MSLHIRKELRNRYFFGIDLVTTVICVVISYLLRFEFDRTLMTLYLKSMYWMVGVALILKPFIYFKFGLYRQFWAYASINEMRLIAMSVASGSVAVTAVMTILKWLSMQTS